MAVNISSFVRCLIVLSSSILAVHTQATPFCNAGCSTEVGTCYNSIANATANGISELWITSSKTYSAPEIINRVDSLTIHGCPDVTLSCAPGGGVFVIRDAIDVTFEGLTIQNCTAGAIVAKTQSFVALVRVNIIGTGTEMSTSAVTLASPVVVIEDCKFMNNKLSLANTSHAMGAGLYLDSTSAVVRNSLFRNNAATEGGGVYNAALATTTLIGCTFDGNICTKAGCGGKANSFKVTDTVISNNYQSNDDDKTEGGGLYSSTGLTAQNITCTGNKADAGGCLYATGLGVISNSTLNGNFAHQKGGVYSSEFGSLILDRCQLNNNTSADKGGAVFVGGNVTATVVQMSHNYAANNAAGVYAVGNFTAYDSTFDNNVAVDRGGVFYTHEGVFFNRCNSMGNLAGEHGGVIYTVSGATVINSTFTENESKNRGGSMYAQGAVVMDNCLFVRNHAEIMAGCAYTTGEVRVNNTIFRNNTAHDHAAGTYSGKTTDLQNCLFENNLSRDRGAALYSKDLLTIRMCVFRNNTSGNRGGAVYGGNDVHSYASVYLDNYSELHGGAVYSAQNVSDVDGIYINNSALTHGGAMYGMGANITNTTFKNNHALWLGGGVFMNIYMNASSALFENNHVGNKTYLDRTLGRGGAVHIYDGGWLEAYNLTARHNRANWMGGVLSMNGPLSIYGSMFTNNSAGDSGGAVYCGSGLNSTFSVYEDNRAYNKGGAMYIEHDSIFIGDTYTHNEADSGGALYSEADIDIRSSTLVSNKAVDIGGAVRAYQVKMSESQVTCNRAGRGAGVALQGFVLNLDNTSSIANNEGTCGRVYFQSGIQCKAEDINDFCSCDWQAEVVSELCGEGAQCDSNRTYASVWDQPCACSKGTYFRPGGGCPTCSTCGKFNSSEDCSNSHDTLCTCPVGKTGPECNDDCILPENCESGDTTTCEFDAADFSFGSQCKKCLEGYYLTEEGRCALCTQCGTGALGDISILVEECTANADTVCECPTGRTGENCSKRCELPQGCADIDVTTSTCTFDITDPTRGIQCHICSIGYFMAVEGTPCLPYTRCAVDEYELKEPNNVTDRVCERGTECEGNAYYLRNLTDKTDAECGLCSSPMYCKIQLEPCTAYSDIVCSECVNGYHGSACNTQTVVFAINEDFDTFDSVSFTNKLTANLEVPSSYVTLERIEEGSVNAFYSMNTLAVKNLESKFLRQQQAPVQNVVGVSIADAPLVDTSSDGDGGLSDGIIALICVLLILAAVVVFLIVGYCAVLNRQRRKSEEKKARIHPMFNLPPDLLKQINEPEAVAVRARARMGNQTIDIKNIKTVQLLGAGNFGVVYFAMLKDSNGHESPVAVKQLNVTDINNVKVFAEEANMMKAIQHNNVLDCIGVSTGPPSSIIMDLMVLGDLQTYLKSQFDRDEPITVGEKYHLSYQIASGMSYLASQGIVHRDLATRNCMLTLSNKNTFGYPTLKVADFGLSRTMNLENSCYVVESPTPLPFRWSSPRALFEGRFSTYSDVWSYGVTLWEIFSDAEEVPYREFTIYTILSYLQSGGRLKKPEQCPRDAYEVMASCWEIVPEKRPDFESLEYNFASLFIPHCSTAVRPQTLEDGRTVLRPGRKNSVYKGDSNQTAENSSFDFSSDIKMEDEPMIYVDSDDISGLPNDHQQILHSHRKKSAHNYDNTFVFGNHDEAIIEVDLDDDSANTSAALSKTSPGSVDVGHSDVHSIISSEVDTATALTQQHLRKLCTQFDANHRSDP